MKYLILNNNLSGIFCILCTLNTDKKTLSCFLFERFPSVLRPQQQRIKLPPPFSHSKTTLPLAPSVLQRAIGLHTTVELLCRQRGHRSALQAAGVVAGGRSLSVARLGVLLEEVGQPQQLAVAVQGVGIQSAAIKGERGGEVGEGEALS